MVKRTLYVVFEGIDGAGKSSQVERLVARLEAEGLAVVRTFEPTDGPIGREIRRRAREGPPLTAAEELALFAADRKEHVEKTVAPGLARGAAVVQDRSIVSTLCYQGARAGGPTREQVLAAHAFALPPPDLVIVLDVPVERGLARVAARGKADAFEERKFLEAVRARFLGLDDPAVRVVDATRDRDAVAADVWNLVAPLVARTKGAPA